MTNIKAVIARYRGNMEAAGLIRQVSAVQLSPQVAAMRPSLTKVRLALQERPDRFAVVQPSPMSLLFDYTLPKIEHILIELGEVRAEQIVNKLCEHGKRMIKEHGVEGAKEHLDALFKDLPDFEIKLKKENGVDEIAEAYRKYDFEGEESFLEFIANAEPSRSIGFKRGHYQIFRNGFSAHDIYQNETFFIYLLRFKGLEDIVFDNGEIPAEGFAHLKKLKNLKRLHIKGIFNNPEIYYHLIDMPQLEGLALMSGFRVEWEYLKQMKNLRRLILYNTNVNDLDLEKIKGMAGLRELKLHNTQVSNAGIEMLKKAMPGVEITI
jgi:hypothetical protein